MTKETLDLIHRQYQLSLEKSSNLMEIAENLYNLLYEIEVCEEDAQSFDSFIDGLRACISYRKKTFEITNLMEYINITLMYIILWLNKTQSTSLDIDWKSRRKSLESDLTKILKKSDSNLSVTIHDRFGIRGILNNDIEEDKAIEYIYIIYNSIVGILANKNRKIRKDFSNWIESNTSINQFDKTLLAKTLEIPFSIDFEKDYIKNPKPNNYQSLQFTMSILVYSDVLPGCQFEVQLRTKHMHQTAETGSASHQQYKKFGDSEEESPVNKVFVVDDFSHLKITNFTSYDSKEDDKDGIHFPKDFSDRRISTTLVPQ